MAYITPDDLYNDEDLDESTYPSAFVSARIATIQAIIERITGRFFEESSSLAYVLDGDGYDEIELPMPCITLTSVEYREGSVWTSISTNYFYNYNDFFNRDYPRLVIIDSSDSVDTLLDLDNFPDAKAAVRVTGTWGYLDKSGNTPEDIKLATKLLTMDYIEKMGDLTLQENLNERGLKILETDLNKWETHENFSFGSLTGNREADMILARYKGKNGGFCV